MIILPYPFIRILKIKFVERTRTGLKDIDSLLEGGIPKGSLVLVAGEAGSGKSTFASHFLAEGLKNNENVIYFSLVESKNAFYTNFSKMGFEFDNNEKFFFLEMPSITKCSIPDMITLLLHHISETNPTRLVIDSLSAISHAMDEDYEIRQILHNTFSKIIREKGITTLFIIEKPHGIERLGGGMEEFIADGIIVLESRFTKEGVFSGNMKIIKMRGTNLEDRTIPYSFARNKGIITFRYAKMIQDYDSQVQRIPTGISGLDEMLNGNGLLKGSVNLISGASGTGKTLLCSQFVNEGLSRSECCLFISYEDTAADIAKNAERIGLTNLISLKRIKERDIDVTSVEEMSKVNSEGSAIITIFEDNNESPDQHIFSIANIIESTKPARLVIDSLSAVQSFLNDEYYFNKYIRTIRKLVKALDITLLCTNVVSTIGDTIISESRISSYFDGIILLKYLELESTIKRSIILLKSRGTDHDKGIREFEIEPGKGLTIRGTFQGIENILRGTANRIKRMEDFNLMEQEIENELETARNKRVNEFQIQERKIKEKEEIQKRARKEIFEKSLLNETDDHQ